MKTEVFTSCAAYLDKVLDRKNEIHQIIPINQDIIRIAYKEKNEYLKENKNSNIVVSLYTTAIARLKLISYVQMVLNSGCTLLYCGTNNMLFNLQLINN